MKKTIFTFQKYLFHHYIIIKYRYIQIIKSFTLCCDIAVVIRPINVVCCKYTLFHDTTNKQYINIFT